LTIRRDLVGALAEQVNSTFLGSSAADTATPAGIAASISTASSEVDLIAHFPGNGGDLERALFVARPELWAGLSGATNPNLSVRSGEYFRIPTIGTKSAPANTLMLVDPGRIAVATGVIRVEAFHHGDIQMQDAETIGR
jgi:hypothetical protein